MCQGAGDTTLLSRHSVSAFHGGEGEKVWGLTERLGGRCLEEALLTRLCSPLCFAITVSLS